MTPTTSPARGNDPPRIGSPPLPASTVGLLLQLGADANALDLAGVAPISCARAEMVTNGVVQMLLDAGGKLDLTGALRLGRYDLAEAMLAKDPQRLGPGGRDTIALHLAIDRKDGAAVHWLIERGVDVNAKRLIYDCNHTGAPHVR